MRRRGSAQRSVVGSALRPGPCDHSAVNWLRAGNDPERILTIACDYAASLM